MKGPRVDDELTPDERSGEWLSRTQVTFVPANVWRVGLVVLAVFGLGLLINFVLDDGGGVLFTVLMSWFAAIAMAPVVRWLSQWMKRGVATMIVMVSAILFATVFFLMFGALFVDQLVQLVMLIPDLIDEAIVWANTTFNLTLSQESILDMAGISAQDMAATAAELGLGLLAFVVSLEPPPVHTLRGSHTVHVPALR